MNTANYRSYNDWRLGSALNTDSGGPCLGNDCTGSELGHLFYVDGGLNAGQSTFAEPPGLLDNYFVSMQSSVYWSGTQSALDPNFAWFFATDDGHQGRGRTIGQFYGWAVRPGQDAAAPLQATGLLVALGLMMLGVSRHERRRFWLFGRSGDSAL